MKLNKLILRTFIVVVFLLGLYFTLNYTRINTKEGLQQRCPNVLIQKGDKIELLNSGLAKIPGVNPVVFNNLEEYVEFTEWQRSRGIECPVLYLQEQYSATGELSLSNMNGDPTQPIMGNPPHDNLHAPAGAQPAPVQQLFDASKDDLPYNRNSFPGYDGTSQYQGVNTPLDKMFNQGERDGPKSANAMDSNWGGVEFSRGVVASGTYDKRTRNDPNDSRDEYADKLVMQGDDRHGLTRARGQDSKWSRKSVLEAQDAKAAAAAEAAAEAAANA